MTVVDFADVPGMHRGSARPSARALAPVTRRPCGRAGRSASLRSRARFPHLRPKEAGADAGNGSASVIQTSSPFAVPTFVAPARVAPRRPRPDHSRARFPHPRPNETGADAE
nr:hypothetical protein [Microbacterium bovistercoris]